MHECGLTGDRVMETGKRNSPLTHNIAIRVLYAFPDQETISLFPRNLRSLDIIPPTMVRVLPGLEAADSLSSTAT
jgi:hypothetical protein